MEARTILDQIEIRPEDGNVQLRFLKQVVGEGGVALVSEYHRTVIPPDADEDGISSGTKRA